MLSEHKTAKQECRKETKQYLSFLEDKKKDSPDEKKKTMYVMRMCWRGKIHAGRLKMVHEKRTVFNRTAPTPYSEDSRCPLAACIT